MRAVKGWRNIGSLRVFIETGVPKMWTDVMGHRQRGCTKTVIKRSAELIHFMGIIFIECEINEKAARKIGNRREEIGKHDQRCPCRFINVARWEGNASCIWCM